MRLLTLLLPSLALAALANATNECASALQLQDTARSSLRSEENELGIRELKSWAAEQKSSMDKAVAALERAVAEQKSFAEKAVEEQKTASKEAATAAASAASWANAEVRVLLGLGAAGFLFLVASPQRAIAMLRAYMGPQHAPP
jgi:hypothetical protein